MHDRETQLQRLASENARWAERERWLIESIDHHYQQLSKLPAIIQRLEAERDVATEEMLHSGAEYDALETESERGEMVKNETETDAEFVAWADDQADEYADWRLTTQPPRPNPFGLFRR